MDALTGLFEAISNGDSQAARSITEVALASGIEPLMLVNQSMIPAMDEAGRKFEANEYFVPDLLIRARAMKTAMALIRPLLATGEVSSLGRIVLGTVKGDVHDIGKNLVAALLEGAGFEVIDLGVGVAPEKFVAVVCEKNAQLVGLSALLTTTMYSMKTTIEAIEQAGLRSRVKVLVGGAPVTRDFADEIGADGTSNSAAGAVILAKLALGLPAQLTSGVHLCTN
jgi:5-methyltetrahydrofolate--homocysteine methyltransferase